MTSKPPVTDWVHDFDHTDPTYVADPYPIWDGLREKCPIADSDRYGGTWLPVTHADVSAIADDTDHFTSRSVVVSEIRPDDDDLPAPIGVAPPITSDPPFHMGARRLLLPAFGPKKIAEYEPFTRELCRELLDALDGQSVVDAAVDYAEHIPLRVIVKMLGFPQEDADIFRRFIRMILEDVDQSVEERQATIQQGELDAYIDARIEEHLAEPRDDLTTFLLEAELDGNKLHPDHVRGTMVLLMVAGIDTTWSAIGASLWHLAQHSGDRERLATEPELMDTAVEEFLRAYAPVTMARMVAEDFEMDGCPMREGDWVLLPFPAANRDPEVFPDAGRVVIDRAENRHSAFGLGIHRCIGSNLARHGAARRAGGVDGALPGVRAHRSERGHLVGGASARPADDSRSHRLTALIRAGRSRLVSAVVGIREVEAAPGVPFGALVAVRGNPARVLQHPGDVQQVPRHERGVPVGEVVLGPTRSGIEVRRPGPGFADPAGIGLRRNHVAEVLQRVQDVHRAVLDPVLVAGDETASDSSVVRVLAGIVEQMGVAVEPLDHLGAHRRLLTQPDRRAQDEDVRRHRPARRSAATRPSSIRAPSCRATRRSRCRDRSRGPLRPSRPAGA